MALTMPSHYLYTLCVHLLKFDIMDLQELTQEVIAFLDATGQYQSFLDWEEDRGHDRDELDNELEKAQEF